MFKKALTTFFLFLFLSVGALSFFATSAHAQANPYYQGPWYLQGPVQWYSKVYDNSNPQEIFGERYTAAQVQWVIYSLFSVAVNTVIPPEVVICAATFDVTGPCSDSAMAILIRMFSNPFIPIPPTTPALPNEPTMAQLHAAPNLVSALLTDRPLSGIGYIRHIATDLHIIPEANAQAPQSGFGYSAFGFIQGLWQGARNITYGIMVLIIVAMAFMIMFRVKLSPQTVITVQSALPKIIITLILVTFSYAIAGFMVDIMYVVIGLISLIFTQSGIFTTSATEMFTQMTDGNLGLGILGVFILYWFRFLLASVMIILTPQGIFSAVPSAIIAVIALLVMTIVLILVTFKALVMLIKTFINIVLLVIAAPLMISFGALSAGGGSLGFGGWFRALAAQLFVYPLVATLLNVSFVFMAAAYGSGAASIIPASWTGGGVGNWMFGVNPNLFGGQTPWAPPLTLGSNPSGLRLMFLFASLGVIGIIPKTTELIQSLIAKKPFSYGSAIGEAFGPVNAPFAYGQKVGATGMQSGAAGAIQSLWGQRGTGVGLGTRLRTAGGDAGRAAAGSIRKMTGT